ncbi:MAG TPA: aldo/keto reductase, partial [archaeon]|nr:aldo/keto reductase [archaeon]
MLNQGMKRRDFLKSSVVGLGAFTHLSSNVGDILPGQEGAAGRFARRTLGKTGMQFPVITMGVMNTSNPALVRAALEAGLFFLDTAQGYQRGTNEAMIGEVLKGRPRDSFALATKAYLPRNQTSGLYGEEATEEAFTKKIDTSLNNLGLDHVDIYHHHGVWTREAALYEPILNALEKAKKAGKT